MRRTPTALASVLCAVTLLVGCGDDEPETAPPTSESIEITFNGDSVTPNGERVEVDRGQEIELVVKSDEPGELHVHSTPAQDLDYIAGTTNLTLVIDEPGVVDIEAHDPEVIIVQLEVS